MWPKHNAYKWATIKDNNVPQYQCDYGVLLEQNTFQNAQIDCKPILLSFSKRLVKTEEETAYRLNKVPKSIYFRHCALVLTSSS